MQDMDVSAYLSNFTGNLMVHIEHELHIPCVIYVGLEYMLCLFTCIDVAYHICARV